MPQSTQDQIRLALKSAEELYHRLVLLVGPAGSGKTRALRELGDNLGTDVVNLNLSLSSELLELTPRQRALRLPAIVEKIVAEKQPTVLLDNLEILFEQSLQQDPLRLLQGLSRNHSVVACWNGAVADGRLSYAELGHPEYRAYETTDLLLVTIDNTATIDCTKNK